MPEATLRELPAKHGFSVSGLACRLTSDGSQFEYRMTIRTSDERDFTELGLSLSALPPVAASPY